MTVKKAPDGPMQTAIVRLPPEMVIALKNAAEAAGRGERGMSEEIRRRLDASLRADNLRPSSRYVGALITNLAESASDNFGYWGTDAFAYEVLVSAIRLFMEPMRPGGDAEPHFNPDGIADLLFDTSDTPETIARSLVAVALQITPNIREAKL